MDLDPRLTNLGVKVAQTPNATWVLLSARYQDETESGGNHHIYFTVRDAAGKPAAGVACIVDWPHDPSDPDDKRFEVATDSNGQVNFPMYANLDITLKNGPYIAFIADRNKSDVVSGMGLPEHRHVNFLLAFGPASPPPPPPGGLEQAVIAAAKKLTWMPINTDAALYKFAHANNLGYPQTDEFEFKVGVDTYVGQVFNLGIVYVKKGDWDKVKWVKKP